MVKFVPWVWIPEEEHLQVPRRVISKLFFKKNRRLLADNVIILTSKLFLIVYDHQTVENKPQMFY